MIVTVNWKYVLLNGSLATGYRVKRRTNGPPPVINGGTDMPMTDYWVSSPAPPHIHYVPDNRDYVFLFWSLTAYDSQTLQRAAQIQPGAVANDAHIGGQWTINATAYYSWDFPSGGGPNALIIDAFDIQAGDFIPDDFVDAKPDPTGQLTIEANNGFIDTSNEIAPQGPGAPPPPPSLTVSARDSLPAKKFAYWLYFPGIASQFVTNYPGYPPTVGFPNPRDIVVHNGDVVVAIAFYTEVPPPARFFPSELAIFDPWWGPKTHWGLTPGPPPPEWLRELLAALPLASSAGGASTRTRIGMYELFLRQLASTSAAVKREIKGLEGE